MKKLLVGMLAATAMLLSAASVEAQCPSGQFQMSSGQLVFVPSFQSSSFGSFNSYSVNAGLNPFITNQFEFGAFGSGFNSFGGFGNFGARAGFRNANVNRNVNRNVTRNVNRNVTHVRR